MKTTSDSRVRAAGAVLRIDLNALVENYRILQRQTGAAEVGAVVKADAYGLGAIPVADALAGAGCRHFFVAHLGEAIALRDGLDGGQPIYVLNGLQPGAEAVAAAAGVVPVLNSLDQMARWAAQAREHGAVLPAVLQVDSGMGRLGLSPEETDQLVAEPDRLEGIALQLVMSHLACGDTPDAEANAQQYARFTDLASRFPGVRRSLDNSGGAFLGRNHFDLVRAGIALYGGAPHVGRPNPMRAVVSLDAHIIQVRDLPAGAGVGYGLTSVAEAPRRIATIGVGYADGWPRCVSNRGSAYIGGRRVPVAGRVSMDSMTLDVTGIEENLLQPGAPVELLGPHQGIDHAAADADTIAYEILTQLGARYARDYLPAGSTPV
ncbi:alanine racemase [Hephaestia caeni]|uniref:Alanine racemase n=1 Tax=Hephaestia caeni TaxID=645617 RepID=A0A397PBT4_9SPHN|nr:alanine racemase [Hephaestia caeni]RIA44577.1 alanine racemase [Hephaestia caeni]